MAQQPIRLAIIISNYYPGYSGMLEAALDEAATCGVHVSLVSEVPGCFDMPLPVKMILQRDDVDAVLALGVILPVPHKTSAGASPQEQLTDWDETIANATFACLDTLALEYEKPVIKELIGPGFPVGTVKGRVQTYARAGVKAAVTLVTEMERLRALPPAVADLQ
jgi:6,7-dimethyl-8-ribityllumazine synthase